MRRHFVTNTESFPTTDRYRTCYNYVAAYSVWHVPVLLTFLSIILAASSLNAQTNRRLSGTVLSEENSTVIPHAELLLIGTSYSTTTDEAGSFGFDNIPLGTYLLHVSAPGFVARELSDIRLVSDITRQIRIMLEPKVYPVSDITVKGKRQLQTSDVTVVDRQQIERLHPKDVSDILESVEGVQIERTGPGGQATIRIRGSSPNQVLVLLDGHRLNASSSGVADLNSVPVSVVERIELHKSGASAQFGPDAMGGVVNIITQPSGAIKPSRVDALLSHGSWHTQRENLSIELPVKSINLIQRLAFEDRSSDGDFDYNYHVSPADIVYEGPRVNNESHSRNLFGSGRWSHSHTQLGYSFQIYDADNGLPGKASQQNEFALREDDRLFISTRLDHQLSPAMDLSLSGGYSRNELYFADRTRYQTRFTDKGVDIKGSLTYRVSGQHELNAGYQFQRNKLDHEDLMEILATGVTRRRTNSLFISGHHPFDISRSGILDGLILTASLRYDHTTTDPEKKQIIFPQPMTRDVVHTESWSPRFGATISRGERLGFVARASWGKSLRLPSISALFWQGDARSAGNPDLKPERAEHLDGGVEINGKLSFLKFTTGVTFYKKDVEDIVIWVQSSPDGIFKPQNLGSAEIRGHEDFVKLNLFGKFLEIQYGNSITHALNKQPGNNYDKVLTYTPQFVTTLSMKLNYRIFFALYDIRNVGKRFALSGNEKWYDRYEIHNMTVGSEFDLSTNWQIQIDGKIDNLRDEPYVLISQHPMPGRSWNLSLTIRYTPKGASQ